MAKRLATVDLNHAFVKGRRKSGSMLARLSELVGTLTGIQGAKRVKLLIDGATTTGLFPGITTGGRSPSAGSEPRMCRFPMPPP